MEMVEEEPNRPKNVQETLEEGEERISALPDCLILQILSLLPYTKDAIRTGILSKRWYSLWTLTTTLIFKHELVMWKSDFVSLVNKTLAQCCHPKLNTFKVFMLYDNEFQREMNDWILYAISRKVEVLNLTLSNFTSKDNFVLDEQFFINSCFTSLTLRGFIYNQNFEISWKMLRSLWISGAKLDEHLIKNLVSGSPVLETLKLHQCYGYRRLCITSESLKNLVVDEYGHPIDDYDDDDDDDDDDVGVDDAFDVIEINAPNILSLKILIDLLLWKLLLVDLSSLVEAEIDYVTYEYLEPWTDVVVEEASKGLIQSLHHVKELKVGVGCYKVLSRLEAKGFPFPSNMKFVDVASPSCSDSDELVSTDDEEE